VKRRAADSLPSPQSKRGASNGHAVAPKWTTEVAIQAAALGPVQERSALRVQAAYRGFAARGKGLAARARARSEAKREAAAAAKKTKVAARARQPEYRELRRCCGGVDVLELAGVDQDLETLVGLGPLKSLCAAVRRDTLARAAVGDPPDVRSVLVSGAVGTGKKLAAELLGRLLRALGVAKGMVSTATTLDQMVLDVRRDVGVVIVDGLGAGAIEARRPTLDHLPQTL